MTDFLTSVDLWIPLVSVTLFIFLSTRLYSLRNMSLSRLNSEFNIAFVMGKIVTKIDMWLVIGYLIINFINGNYLKPIIIVVLGLLIGRALTMNKNLKPSTAIPYEIMTFNCILFTLVFIVFGYYVYSLI